MAHLLICVLVLDPQPVVDSFLTHSFMIEPAAERKRETKREMNHCVRDWVSVGDSGKVTL